MQHYAYVALISIICFSYFHITMPYRQVLIEIFHIGIIFEICAFQIQGNVFFQYVQNRHFYHIPNHPVYQLRNLPEANCGPVQIINM